MPKSFLCRVGIAQIQANPAYADSLVSNLQEPNFPDGPEKIGLFTVAGIEPINTLRKQIATEYVAHLNRKLDPLIRFAKDCGVEILVFPDYSIPPDSLSLCRSLSDELNIGIVAGSHVVTPDSGSQQVYRSLGIPSTQTDQGADQLGSDVKLALSIVFAPGQPPLAFARRIRSKWDSNLFSDAPPLHSFMLNVNSGKLEVQLPFSLDHLALITPKEKHTHPRLAVVSAFTATPDEISDGASRLLMQGKCSLLANNAEYGGSRLFATVDDTRLWFSESNGSTAVPQRAEALLIADLDLEKQFEMRNSRKSFSTLGALAVYPCLYEPNSAETRQFIQLLDDFSSSGKVPADLPGRLPPFTTLTTKVFPAFLQEKLRYFLSTGTSTQPSSEEFLSWVQPLRISETYSTDIIRWNLCNKAIETVNSLLVSPDYVTRTKQLLDVYSFLMMKRNELAGFIQPVEERQEGDHRSARPIAEERTPESPFYDRDQVFDRIRTFINQREHAAFVLKGMRGIGKTSLLQMAFRQAIPPAPKKLWLQLTEGVSYSRLVAHLAYACNLQLSERLDDVTTLAAQAEVELRIVSSLSQPSGAIVVLDEFQYLLAPSGEIEDARTRGLLTKLLTAAGRTATKYFFVSHISPKMGAELDPHCYHYLLQGLTAKDTERLIHHWFQVGRETLTGELPTPSDKFLSVLSGHPLATRVAALLWAEHPSRELVDDVSIFKELRDTIVSFILEKLTVTPDEGRLLAFTSIFRLPAPRDAFIKWGGEQANLLLTSLTSQFLVETTDAGYQLHPLVRDFYYNDLPLKVAADYHKVAGRFYLDLFDAERLTSRQLNPLFLGEAVHHFLAAGDRRRVQELAFYKQELKPVALMHYRRRDFKLALADYRVLIELDSNDPDAHLHLALIYGREKKWGDAEYHFGRAISLRPNAYWILQAYGSAKLNANMIAEAEDLLCQAENANPNSAATLIDLGRLYERKDDLESAEHYFRRAIQIDPDNSFAYYNLARLLYRIGDIRAAYEMAISALASRPVDDRNKQLVQELKSKVSLDGTVDKRSSSATKTGQPALG